MKATKLLLLATTAVTVALLSGCAGDAATEDTALDEGAMRRTVIAPNAVAVEIHTVPMGAALGIVEKTVTIALPSKMNRVLRAIQPRGDEPVPRCMPSYRHDLRFFDAQGQEVSKATYSCSGIGNVYVGSDVIKVTVNDVSIENLLAEPLAVGDALWGITDVVVKNFPLQKTETVTSPDEVTDLVQSIDPEQQIVPPDPGAPAARCAPTYAITYKRGASEAAQTSFLCGDPTADEVEANFQVPASEVSGRVKLDPRAFADLFVYASAR